MNVGLTGGIATGKSTVSSMLVNKGAILVDADRIAREVVQPGQPALSRVVEHFGPSVLHEDGSLNRKRLGEIVFSEPRQRRILENILHPAIRSRMLEQMKRAEAEFPDRLVVVDVPLLYESGLESCFEEVLVVYVPVSVQMERLMKRNQLTREEAQKRLKSQWPIDRKKELADIVIDNSGPLENTERQVAEYWRSKGLDRT